MMRQLKREKQIVHVKVKSATKDGLRVEFAPPGGGFLPSPGFIFSSDFGPVSPLLSPQPQVLWMGGRWVLMASAGGGRDSYPLQ